MDNYNQSPYDNEQTRHFGFEENRVGENIVVNNNAKSTLLSISKWVKFLSIVGIIMAALLILIGIAFMGLGSSLSSMDGFEELRGAGGAIGGLMGIIYIIIAAIYVYPVIKMLNYANKMKKAVMANRQDYYEDALDNFKSGVTYIGILTIIALVFNALGIVGFIIGIALQ